MKHWLQDLFTDQNGDADETVLYVISGIFTFLGLSVYDVVVLDHAFNAQSFGIGFGAIIAAGLSGYGLKAKLERRPDGP